MQEHPRTLMFMCVRKNEDASHKPNLITSTKIDLMKKSVDAKAMAFNLDSNKLKNSSGLSKIRDEEIKYER